MTAAEIARFYRQIHEESKADHRADRLSPVIHPGGSRYLNAFADYAHRLGMNKAFNWIESRHQSLSNWSVLDLGCGNGRWSKEYAARGARVTGVDISPEAIDLLTAEMPAHTFLCKNISELAFHDENFDCHLPRFV